MDPVEPAVETPVPRATALPPLWRRYVDVFVAPEKAFEALARNPRWAGALVLGAVMVLVGTALIPTEVWSAFVREQLVARGQEIPAGRDFGPLQRTIGMVAGTVGWAVMTFLMAGVVSVVFAFLLGDQGRYGQHLAILAHAFLIAATGALLITPLRIVQADPTLTLNLSLFAVGLDPDSYPMKVLRLLDLFQLWSWVVVAVGLHALDRRRSVASASAILLAFAVALAAVFANFV